MAKRKADLEEIRAFYARQMAAASNSDDPRLEQAFAEVPREDFVGPGPWNIMGLRAALARDRYQRTPSDDPVYLYQNVLVALDPSKGINNGEPFLHAAWIGAVAPQPGEIVVHVGAGTGYYTAILAKLVEPGGMVHAFEIEPALAERARANLAPYGNVTVIKGDAVGRRLPPSDIVYVNAGVAAPPLEWLRALKPGGRLIFPWRPTEEVGLAMLVTRVEAGFACKPLMHAWFIPCIGAAHASAGAKLPEPAEAGQTRAIWPVEDKAPDDTATAVFDKVWFSSGPVAATPSRQ